MRRIAVISTNNNPDYFFYVPIVEWAWNKLGWEIALFLTEDCKEIRNDWLNYISMTATTTHVYTIPNIEGVRTGTLAQTVRHFVADVLPKDAYIMVQDIDLIPLKEWNPNLDEQTIYGWELTGKSFIPVHYTGMLGQKWYDLMDCTGDLKADMEREMKANGRAYLPQEDWEGWWNTDWDILTQKVLAKKEQFTFIPRELVKLAKDATPKGRIDRYDIDATMNQEDMVDAHLSNHNPSAPEKVEILKTILLKYFGELPEWLDNYILNHHAKYGQGR